MDVCQVLRMNGGEGDTSYSKNSSVQKLVILKTKQIVEESVNEFCRWSLPEECVRVADLGCSSGPNALLPTWEIILSLHKVCRALNKKQPPIQVFLNDLATNDFNTVFKLLPEFCKKLENGVGMDAGGGSCSIAAVPGSFYGRLFVHNSIHLIYSSYCLHWLSQIPTGLVTDTGVPLNKGRVCESDISPPSVHVAYSNQFQKDFTDFLNMRFQELVPQGRLILAMLGKEEQKDGSDVEDLIGIILNDMAMEGLIQQATLDMFNIPIYAPSLREVKGIIESQGSFEIKHLERYKERCDSSKETDNQELLPDYKARGVFVAKHARAIYEPILRNHFGEDLMDHLFLKYAEKVSEYLQTGKGWVNTLIISLIKK